jgi:formate dehydrogenase subunit beta
LTESDKLDLSNPIAPVMPVNASKAVQDFSRLTPSKKPIAVVLKPCEIRALVELIKLKQANIENILIIGVDCAGTYAINDHSKGDHDTQSIIESYKNQSENENLRSACTACEHFTPSLADITIGLYGLDLNKDYLVGLHTKQAIKILEPLRLSFEDLGRESEKKSIDKDLEKGSKNKKLTKGPKELKQLQIRTNAIEELKKLRNDHISKFLSETEMRIKGLDKFLVELSSCINCHNCMTVCPICYCKECFFDSPTFDLESEKIFKMAEFKGALRLPSNMFLFHVTRFNHMVLSCVACGMCEQGCPADIPLLSIYKTVGTNAQRVFDYEPGRSLEEEIPILTFEEDELEPK